MKTLLTITAMLVLFSPTIIFGILYIISNENWKGLSILLGLVFQIGLGVIIFMKTNKPISNTC